MSNCKYISANIPVELNDVLTKVASIEERSKTYYIRKGLESILREKLENLEDYNEAKSEYEEFLLSGKKGVSLSKVFKNTY